MVSPPPRTCTPRTTKPAPRGAAHHPTTTTPSPAPPVRPPRPQPPPPASPYHPSATPPTRTTPRPGSRRYHAPTSPTTPIYPLLYIPRGRSRPLATLSPGHHPTSSLRGGARGGHRHPPTRLHRDPPQQCASPERRHDDDFGRGYIPTTGGGEETLPISATLRRVPSHAAFTNDREGDFSLLYIGPTAHPYDPPPLASSPASRGVGGVALLQREPLVRMESPCGRHAGHARSLH